MKNKNETLIYQIYLLYWPIVTYELIVSGDCHSLHYYYIYKKREAVQNNKCMCLDFKLATSFGLYSALKQKCN